MDRRMLRFNVAFILALIALIVLIAATPYVPPHYKGTVVNKEYREGSGSSHHHKSSGWVISVNVSGEKWDFFIDKETFSSIDVNDTVEIVGGDIITSVKVVHIEKPKPTSRSAF